MKESGKIQNVENFMDNLKSKVDSSILEGIDRYFDDKYIWSYNNRLYYVF